jgi:hypothetical protein
MNTQKYAKAPPQADNHDLKWAIAPSEEGTHKHMGGSTLNYLEACESPHAGLSMQKPAQVCTFIQKHAKYA